MNTINSRFDWNHAFAFLATAENGSLSAAAKALSVSQPTLGRQVSALESSLGVVLFERTGRGLQLTPTGAELLIFVRKMYDAADGLSLKALGESAEISGSVVVSATEIAAAFKLPPIIRELQTEYPEIEITLVADNETSNLKQREADIALRAYRPTQNDLITKKVESSRGRFYASASYLEKLGDLSNPANMQAARFVGFSKGDQYYGVLKDLGLNVHPENLCVYSKSHLVHWELIKNGCGIGIVPEDLGDAEPKVERAFDNQVYIPFDLWLTAHAELRTSRRLRIVFDYLAESLAGTGTLS